MNCNEDEKKICSTVRSCHVIVSVVDDRLCAPATKTMFPTSVVLTQWAAVITWFLSIETAPHPVEQFLLRQAIKDRWSVKNIWTCFSAKTKLTDGHELATASFPDVILGFGKIFWMSQVELSEGIAVVVVEVLMHPLNNNIEHENQHQPILLNRMKLK
jgi:hypothetical protein